MAVFSGILITFILPETKNWPYLGGVAVFLSIFILYFAGTQILSVEAIILSLMKIVLGAFLIVISILIERSVRS